MRIFNIYFSLRSNGRKIVFKNISNPNWISDSTIVSFKIFGISDGFGLIINY